MKKYTNKILIIAGIVTILLTVVFVSCSVNEWLNTDYDYDSNYYYDDFEDDDYILDEDRY